MLIENNQKIFEKPDTGQFAGTIIDIVDLGKVRTKFGEKVKVRIVWVLDKNDSEGQPYRVMRQLTASVHEKSQLTEVVKGITGQAPVAPFDPDTLIGRSNMLWITKEKDATSGKDFANVKAILPLPAGMAAPPIPQGFVRSKDRPVTVYAQSGAPAVAAGAANTTASAPTAQPTVQGTAPANPGTSPAPAQVQAPEPAAPAQAPVATAAKADAAF